MLTYFFKFRICTLKNICNKEFNTIQSKRSLHPQLSPYDINCILRENEFSHTFTERSIKGYDSNQLASNNPIEDFRSEASFLHQNGFICGVFDGHGGPSCSQVISKRLLRYIAASLIHRELLKDELYRGANSRSFLKCHNDKVDFVKEIKNLYEENFIKYATELCYRATVNADRIESIEKAFLRLDDDLSTEAQENPNIKTLSVAMSGAVACVAVVEDKNLYIANTGDCCAVLGTYSDTGKWVSKKLTQEHNTDNIQEVKRILSEHPETEKETIIRNERLLNQLAPLRAFGDFRYKWPSDLMEKLVVPEYGESAIPQFYFTPPYLTARPDVTHHILTPNDKFLVLASDGLWDFLTPSQVVDLVGDHIMGKAFLKPFILPEKGITLGEISKILAQRRAGRRKKPQDQNSATHLIRYALGASEYGIEHSKLSHMLSLPQEVVRLFRDDITIIVLYFDSEYIASNC